MVLKSITHIVLYRPYREPIANPLQYTLFSDVREAMSFAGSHSRYCSTMECCKVDFELTEELLKTIINK